MDILGNLDKVLFIADTLGIFGILAERLNARLTGRPKELLGEVLDAAEFASETVSGATAEITKAFADGRIDEAELKEFARIAGKALSK